MKFFEDFKKGFKEVVFETGEFFGAILAMTLIGGGVFFGLAFLVHWVIS